MAIKTSVPPQAYTRDTLVKAIEWIATQPPAVRERANSADLIVSFYLQARRRMTAAQLESPVSGENFKQDLKHLAQDLKQFDEPAAPPTMPNRALSHGPFELPDPIPAAQNMNSHHNHLHTAPAPHAHAQQHVHLHVQTPHMQQSLAQPPPHPQVVQHHPQAAGTTASKGITWHVDGRSLAAAREIQERLNLSSEGDALRMLVTLGMQRAREMFP